MHLSRWGKVFRQQRRWIFWWVQSKFVGDKAAASRTGGEKDKDHAERARPQSVSVGNGGGRTKQASMELHWDCYSPEARERLETLRMQGLTWRLSCARSWPHTPMSCRFHHGEHAELLSLEVDAKACDMTQTSHTGGSSSTLATEGWKDETLKQEPFTVKQEEPRETTTFKKAQLLLSSPAAKVDTYPRACGPSQRLSCGNMQGTHMQAPDISCRTLLIGKVCLSVWPLFGRHGSSDKIINVVQCSLQAFFVGSVTWKWHERRRGDARHMEVSFGDSPITFWVVTTKGSLWSPSAYILSHLNSPFINR